LIFVKLSRLLEMENWITKIENGARPSQLLRDEIEKLNADYMYSTGDLVNMFLDGIESSIDLESTDILSVYAPMGFWERPDKRNINGVSDINLDKFLIELLMQWELLPPEFWNEFNKR